MTALSHFTRVQHLASGQVGRIDIFPILDPT